MVRKDDTLHGKAGFDHLYNRPDPRSYFQTLGDLDYDIPQHAHAVFAALVRARAEARTPGGGRGVLDICCSYGVNAALLRCELTLGDLFDRYDDPALADLSPDEVAAADRAYYAGRLRPDPPRVLGLDVADHAVAYGRKVGLLDDGWAENLETDDPSPALGRAAAQVGLITITGGVGYITERTFDRLLDGCPGERMPWVAAFVLRMYSYDRIASTLARRGLVTERLAGTTFPQRRFESTAEQDAAIQGVRSRGLDAAGKEESGWYHCDFFLSRPRADTEAEPLERLLAGHAPAPDRAGA